MRPSESVKTGWHRHQSPLFVARVSKKLHKGIRACRLLKFVSEDDVLICVVRLSLKYKVNNSSSFGKAPNFTRRTHLVAKAVPIFRASLLVCWAICFHLPGDNREWQGEWKGEWGETCDKESQNKPGLRHSHALLLCHYFCWTLLWLYGLISPDSSRKAISLACFILQPTSLRLWLSSSNSPHCITTTQG